MKLVVLLVAVGLCWYVLRPLRVSQPGATAGVPGASGTDDGASRSDDDCACETSEVCA